MLNRVCLQGRLTKDVESKFTSNQTAVASFTLACDRPFKNEQGNSETDFINCVAWRQTATFLSRYFSKGDMVIVSGRLQTRKYEKNGSTVYVTEVVVDEANFAGSSKKNEDGNPAVDEQPDVPFEV